MYPFKDRGNVSVEVVEVGDKFDEAKINESIFAADYAAVDFFFNSRRIQLVR